MSSVTSNQALCDQVAAATGVQLSHCYQCGKCAAGCPLGEEMDIAPCQVLRLLQLRRPDLDRKVLSSEGIWLCVGCETCVTRCPQEVDLPKVMDFLRQKAIKEKLVSKKGRNTLAFHKSFLQSIQQTGRVFEVGLVTMYKLRSKQFWQDVPIAPRMFLKGKLGLLPHLVKDLAGLRRIFTRATEKK